MYHSTGPVCGAAAACGLAFTGFNIAAYLVAAATLTAAGFALLRLLPHREA